MGGLRRGNATTGTRPIPSSPKTVAHISVQRNTFLPSRFSQTDRASGRDGTRRGRALTFCFLRSVERA